MYIYTNIYTNKSTNKCYAVSYHIIQQQARQHHTTRRSNRAMSPDEASLMLIRANKSCHGLDNINGCLCIGCSHFAAPCHGKLLSRCCVFFCVLYVFCVLCCVTCWFLCVMLCFVLFFVCYVVLYNVFCVLCIVFLCVVR